MIQFYNNSRLYVKILQESPFTAHRFPVMMYHNGTFIYSSCNPVTLAKDLTAMPSLRPVEGRLFDMFPHTTHAEVALLLERA